MMTSVLHLFQNYTAKKENRPDYADFLRQLQEKELANVERALPLFYLDERLGLHLECQSYLVSREKLEQKLQALKKNLAL